MLKKIKTLRAEPSKLEIFYIGLLATIQFAHIVDFVILMPLGPTLMDDLEITPTQFASLISSYNFSAATSGLLFSAIADRFDRKRLLVLTLIGFIFGALLCFYSSSFEKLLLARILTGSFGGILSTLIYTIVTDLIPYQRRGRAMGVIMSAFSIASVLGIPIGLWVADTFGWQKTFLLNASFSFLLLVFSIIVFPQLSDCLIKRSPLDVLKQYVRLLKEPRYIMAHSFIFLVGSSMFLLIPFLSPYAVRNIGIQTTDLKYMYLVAGFFTVITARVFGKMTDAFGARKMFVGLCLISIVPVLIYTNAPPMNLLTFIAMSTLFMTLVSGRMIPCMTFLSEVPRPEDRGGFMAILNSVRSFGAAFATLVGGWVITETNGGPLEGFNYAGYLSVTMILFTAFSLRFLTQRAVQNSASPNSSQDVRDF